MDGNQSSVTPLESRSQPTLPNNLMTFIPVHPGTSWYKDHGKKAQRKQTGKTVKVLVAASNNIVNAKAKAVAIVHAVTLNPKS